MNKTLSIIIPTYNMEELLPRCLNSLVSARCLDELDILVVNDGSRDRSLEIAQSYEKAHQQSIRVIDKANGHYGSTINAALPLAEGVFVRILDSDDYYDTDSLERYVSELRSLDGDVDVSVTHFHIRHKDGSVETVKYNIYGREPYTYGRVYDLDEVLAGGYIRFFLMHSLAYRTDLLREHSYHQTEGIAYTDTQWASYPFFWARNIVFHDLILYEYGLDRAGQTMDSAVLAVNLPQLGKMTLDMLSFYRGLDLSSLSETRRSFMKQYFKNRIRLLIKTHLLDVPRSGFDASAFSALDEGLQAALKEFDMGNIQIYPDNKLVRVDAYKYWQRHQSRLPAWLEALSKFADTIVTSVFVSLFHR